MLEVRTKAHFCGANVEQINSATNGRLRYAPIATLRQQLRDTTTVAAKITGSTNAIRRGVLIISVCGLKGGFLRRLNSNEENDN